MTAQVEHLSSHTQGEEPNLVDLWRRFDCGVDTGANGLVALAMRVLSIVPNTAAAERSFSKMGIVHNKLRNRLNAQRVRATVVLREDVEHQYPRPIKRKPRHFGSQNNRDINSDEEEDVPDIIDTQQSAIGPPEPTTTQIEGELGNPENLLMSEGLPSVLDVLGEEECDPVMVVSRESTVPVQQGLFLEYLFDYSQQLPVTFGSWQSGESRLQTEMLCHEIIDPVEN